MLAPTGRRIVQAGSTLRTARERAATAYRATHGHVRAVAAALGLAALALLLGRVDLAVLATPFVVVALWGWAGRPQGPTRLTLRTPDQALTEGGLAPVTLEVAGPPEADTLSALWQPAPFVSYGPASGTRAVALGAGTGSAQVTARAERWGRHPVGPVTVRIGSVWDAYCSEPVDIDPVTLRVLPELEPFAGRSGTPHPQGLAGSNAARHLASGVEFADIRPFTPGDRLRHISWSVSLRTGSLHVTQAHAEVDAEVVLLVDALADSGEMREDTRTQSTLDRSVRAAASLGSYFLGRGDRVGLDVIGAREHVHVPAASGRHQLRRLLDGLSTVDTGRHDWVSPVTPRLRARAGALVLVVTPAISPTFLGWAVHLRRQGYRVVVVDTLGGATPPVSGAAALTWRLRLLQREDELRRTSARSVPAVTWRGTGSLDVVLRELGRGRGR